MTIDEIITHFHDVKRTPNGYQVRCPSHDDSKASLCISTGDKHNTVMKCFAGCSTSDILATVGLSMSDLFDEPLSKQERTKPPAKAHGAYRGEEEVRYPYTDADGTIIYYNIRYKNPKTFRPCRPDPSQPDGYAYNLDGITRVLYRLPYVIEAATNGRAVFLTEGEKDADNINRELKMLATTGGGTTIWNEHFTNTLRGAHVVILPDNDEPGIHHAETIARELYGNAASVRILMLPDLPHKGDVSDWIEAGGTREQLQQLAKDCPLYEPPSENINQSVKFTDMSSEKFSITASDVGNSMAMAAQHGENIRFVAESKNWIIWNGKVWVNDDLGEIRKIAEQTIRNQFQYLSKLAASAEFEAYAKWLKTSLSLQKLDAMVKLSATNQKLGIRATEMDCDDWTLNCKNGTLDLRTGILRPHRREDLTTRIIDIDYNEHAECPRWEQFVNEVFQGDKQLIGYVQRSLGYTLTGDTSEQCFFIMNGNGANGKSTLINVMREIMGAYHTKTSTETLLRRPQGSSTTDLAALNGARFVSAVEANAQRHLAEELVKELVGGDPITARFLYQNSITFMPKLKLWLACNHMPKIDNQDNGMWRRIKIIPFNVKFSYREENGIPCKPPYRDNMLPDTLRMEYSGILAWMMRGCIEWQSKGLGSCSAVDGATLAYKTDQDLMDDFFNEECEFNPNYDIRVMSLYDVYHTWAERTGTRAWAYKTFISKLKEHDIIKVVKSMHGVCCNGVRLKTGDFLPTEDTDKTNKYDGNDGNNPILQTSNNLDHREKNTEVIKTRVFPSCPSYEHENEGETAEIDQIHDANKIQPTDTQQTTTSPADDHPLFRAATALNYPSISYSLEHNGETTVYGIPANKTAWKNQISQMIHNDDKQRIQAVAKAIKAKAEEMNAAKEWNEAK